MTRRPPATRRALRPLAALAAGLALGALLLVVVARPVRVHGSSMVPLLRPGDVVLALVVPGHRALVRPGDVVVADVVDRRGAPSRVVKRVRALVRRPDGSGSVELEGINRPASRDSRAFGTLPLDRVRGLVLARVYPLPPRGLRGRVPEPPGDASGGAKPDGR